MVVAFGKTERGVACDESFYVEHEVYGYAYVPLDHILRVRNKRALCASPPGKLWIENS